MRGPRPITFTYLGWEWIESNPALRTGTSTPPSITERVKGSTPKSNVGGKQACMAARDNAGCVVRKASAMSPQSSGLGTAIPRGAVSQMPSVSWLLSLLLCVLWAGGANKTPQAFSRSPSADTGGLWIRPPMVCLKSDADIFKLQRCKCWKT